MDGAALDAPDGPNPFAAEAAAGPLELPAPEPRRPPNVVTLADAKRGGTDRDGYREDWRRLAASAGSIQAGLNHGRLEPGQLTCPPHWHSAEEECFFVLEGSGQAWLGDERFDIRPGHILVCPPAGPDHAICAGPEGLAYLVFGTRVAGDYVYYPRSRKLNFGNGVLLRVEEVVDYYDGE